MGGDQHPAAGTDRNRLKEHLGAAVAYMTVSRDYPDFIEKLDRFRPRYGEQYQLPFDYYPEHDDGKGL